MKYSRMGDENVMTYRMLKWIDDRRVRANGPFKPIFFRLKFHFLLLANTPLALTFREHRSRTTEA